MDVKLLAQKVANGVEWTIDGKKPHDSVIDLPKKSGNHTLDFQLDDRTDLGFRFNDRDPIWVHQNDQGDCPPQGINSEQISVVSCKPKKLSISDQNDGDPCTLHYLLNLVDASGQPTSIDPIIKNGGST